MPIIVAVACTLLFFGLFAAYYDYTNRKAPKTKARVVKIGENRWIIEGKFGSLSWNSLNEDFLEAKWPYEYHNYSLACVKAQEYVNKQNKFWEGVYAAEKRRENFSRNKTYFK